MAAHAARAGFDYWESNVIGILHPREDEDAFQRSVAALRSAALPCPVLNCFIPGDLKITGPAVDGDALDRYMETVLDRAQRAGVDIIVFGSGGARQVPDGFDRSAAWDQLVRFGQRVAAVAAAHQVVVVVEPLSRGECNVLTTVDESARLVIEVNQPSFRLLVDGYHWLRDGDSAEAIRQHGALLRHAHVATVPNRKAPGTEPCPGLPAFYEALRGTGYDARLSIEARIPDPAADLPRALAEMRAALVP